MKLALAIVGAPIAMLALLSAIGPWAFAAACFLVAANVVVVRWFRVMGAVNASIALQSSNRSRFEP